jgi:hypothetical protein
MPLLIDFEKSYYDGDRQAVVIPANDAGKSVTCLVTSTALNDRAGTAVEDKALLLVMWSLREEIQLLVGEMYRLGHFTTKQEIWLTSRELYR